MPTLHGSWIISANNCSFFFWGEIWRSQHTPVEVESIPPHPYNLTQIELSDCLRTNQLYSQISNQDWQTEIITLPSQNLQKKEIVPILSEQIDQINLDSHKISLKEWKVGGLSLPTDQTIPLLASLPLNSLPSSTKLIGDDLRFWCHIYRWSLDLLARRKFIPGIVRETPETAKSLWQPLLDSIVDQTRLAKFTRLMPRICSAYASNQEKTSQTLLINALTTIVNDQITQWLDSPNTSAKASTIQKWLQTLGKQPQKLIANPNELQRIETSLNNWTLPIQEYIVNDSNYQLRENQFRLCFILTPPETLTGDWQLNYCLQALDDAEFLVEAATIWENPVSQLTYQGRIIDNPQETLLKGLGYAARLYPPILTSLEKQQPVACELSGIEVYQFIRGIALEFEDNGLGIILPPGLNLKTNEKRLGVSINAQVKEKKGQKLTFNSLLDYKLAIAIGDKTISQQQFNRLLAAKSPLVEVDGEWIALQPADVKAVEEIFKSNQPQATLSVEDAIRLSTKDTKVFAKLPIVKFQAEGILAELIDYINNNQRLETISQPPAFQGKLRPYQLRGVSWLAFLNRWGFGACLADDMGLGKTPQLLAFLLHLQREESLHNPILVVCPTSVISNWAREAAKFSPSLRVIIHHGDKRYQGKQFSQQLKGVDVVITSYSLLPRDEATLQSVTWQGVVLDEAQNIKNPTAKQSQSVRKLSADLRIALTGTPVENRLSELWSIIDYINPGWLGNRQYFQRRFSIPIEKYGDNQSLQELRSLISPFMLRRLKTDPEISQDLPEKQEMNVFCSLSAQQAQLYQDLVESSLAKLETIEGIKRKGMILTLLLKLKQICNHPAQFTKEKSLDSSQSSGKLLRLEEMLEELIEAGDRALIFTQFSEWGKLLQPYLSKKLNREVLFLYGATRRVQRQEMIDRFQNDPNGPPIFILSLKAGGTGLNLTRANHVFHVDRWWNPAVENQATDRAFRLGQTRNVQVHKFISTGTIEEKINALLESKRELAEQTVATGEDWLTELDTNQLRDLILLDRQDII